MSAAHEVEPAPVRPVSSAQRTAPYVEALQAYLPTRRFRLHLPGHAGDSAGPAPFTELFGGRLAELDLMPMVDGIDLGPAPTPFDRSLALAAEAWGARRTWFLTNGASQGNHMVSIALRSLGDSLLVQRSVHASVIEAMVLTGAAARFVRPRIDAARGIAHGVTAEDVAAALARMKAERGLPAAVYVVSPSYYGFVSDVAAIAAVAHAEGIPLVVDEAWGAHLGFHPRLPLGALRLGADLVVSSTHKQAGSLTQSAMLHLADGPFAERLEPLLERAHRTMQTTSESAVLRASLDLTRRALVLGEAAIGETIRYADAVRDELRRRGRFRIGSDDFREVPGWVADDPLKIVVETLPGGITGYEARALLDAEGILVELANESMLVGVLGAGTTPRMDPAALVDTLMSLPVHAGRPPLPLPVPDEAPARMTVREAYFAPSEIVSAREAVGRTSADTVSAYPPGIPNLLPGEPVTAEAVEFLQAVGASPYGHVRGALDPEVSALRVVRDG